MLRHRQIAGRDRTFKCWGNLAYGGWVATVLPSNSRGAGGLEMKVLLLSFVVGLAVGVLYGLIRVKSPAPPIVALLGLLGMVLGEQTGARLLTKNIHAKKRGFLSGRKRTERSVTPSERAICNFVSASWESPMISPSLCCRPASIER